MSSIDNLANASWSMGSAADYSSANLSNSTISVEGNFSDADRSGANTVITTGSFQGANFNNATTSGTLGGI